MPVRKLRSLVEAEESLWLAPDDPRLWSVIAQVWATAEALAPMKFPAGVHKHRSIAAMNAQTELWADERIRRARARLVVPAADISGGAAHEGGDEVLEGETRVEAQTRVDR